MAFNIPSNKIVENLYTKGGEYIPKDAMDIVEMFIGFYNILFNGKIFTGKTYNKDSVELISVDDFNKSKFENLGDTIDDSFSGMKYFAQDDSDTSQLKFKQISPSEYNLLASKPIEQRSGIKLIAVTYNDIENNMDKIDKMYPGFAAYYNENPDEDKNIVKKNYSVSFDFNS